MPEKPGKLMPALYGGIIMAVISSIPFLNIVNCLCCAGILFGGFMAVFFYQKDLAPGQPPLTNGDALQLGALSGLFGAIIGIGLMLAMYYTIGNPSARAMGDLIMGFYDKIGLADKIPPEQLQEMQEQFDNPTLSPVSLLGGLILDPLFGLLGGLIGYMVYKPKDAAGTTGPPAAA
jgi:hypothetical protein